MEKGLKKMLSMKGDENILVSAVFIKNNSILLGLNDSKGKKKEFWACPNSKCKKGEILKKAVKRTVIEETGIKKIKIMKFLGEFDDEIKMPLFLCETFQFPALKDRKIKEWRWFKLDKIPKNFINQGLKRVILGVVPINKHSA